MRPRNINLLKKSKLCFVKWHWRCVFIFDSNSYMSTILLRHVRVQENGHYIFTARSASVNGSIVFTIHVYRESICLIENQRSHKRMKPKFDHVFFPNIQRSLILKLSGKMEFPLVWRLVILYPGFGGSSVKIPELCMSSLLYKVVCFQEICEDALIFWF